VRHFYIHPTFRRRSLGRVLAEALVSGHEFQPGMSQGLCGPTIVVDLGQYPLGG
jgi:hypothetical protein